MSDPTIYLYTELDIMDDLVGCALAEDGSLLAQWPFPSDEAARARMERPCKIYRQHYPNGYRVGGKDSCKIHTLFRISQKDRGSGTPGTVPTAPVNGWD